MRITPGLTQNRYQESKKLGSSVDKFQKEFEMRLKDLSLQQSLLIASQQKRQSRRGSLPSGPTFELLHEERTKKTNARTLKNSFSDSAIYQCALRGDAGGKEKGIKLEPSNTIHIINLNVPT